ncbi:transcription-repair coupling factor [Lujinxingia litoralis]|uniref:Transcription-repair-coupling factor n=1 Tax=Lujinxingia litoralis TaxID=2211119 RepID=A0A328C8C1_9DELT|nr:transcription-repair coupling factor [Lujinxingia litoralis]RAL22175.1 transcription-repair coupling factor [Lujinxingia litoralis]
MAEELAQNLEEAPREQVTPEREERYPVEVLAERIGDGQAVEVQAGGGGLMAAVLADLSGRLGRPVVVLTAEERAAERLADDLRLFCGEVEDLGEVEGLAPVDETLQEVVVHYPSYDVGPFYQATADRRVTMGRLAALHTLSGERPPRYVVSSVGAAIRRTLSPQVFAHHSHRLEVESTLDNERLREVMGHLGYSEVPVVEDPGTFAVRGDIVDIYSPHEEHPVRVERWGDEVAEIRQFHRETQRSIEERSHCDIFAVREAILDKENVGRAIGRLRALSAEMGRPSSDLRDLIADLQAGLHVVGIEALVPALYQEMGDLLDYVPADAVVVVLEPGALMARARGIWEKRRREFEASRADEEYVFEVGEYYRGVPAMGDWLGERLAVEWRRVAMIEDAAERGWAVPEERVEFRVRENNDVIALRKHFQGVEQTVKALGEKLPEWKERYGRICFACRTRAQSERLVELLGSYGHDAMVLPAPLDISEPVPPPADVLEVYAGELSAGFRSELLGVALISGVELFGQRVVTHERKSITEHAAISHFKDLNDGDLVVHVDFGIGRYRGIAHLDVEGIANDFLHIEYAGGDKLYLPVYRLGRVQKYIGGGDNIALDKLGGTRWDRTKEKVKENIRELAGDLLALYAKRELTKGIAFSPPDAFYEEFEQAFPFDETPDQARAIHEVLRDMGKARPMDRLICGDVGFGKTEVGIRAAMKAVMDGKQVAVLVPTTLLSEQHAISFEKRVKAFGARVAAINRFRSAKEVKEILADTAAGKIDVLIGTHRILSKDVEFADLGLLVVDEEQRFGVAHKEKIKQLRANIDVLTLSATPIPRTLQMSMLGIRDLSIIATPPHNRLSVRTHVARFSDSVVREAIMRELGRGGQVFFVHNRVQTIEEMARHLREIVPEARIGIGHGQMGEGKLEEVMYAYIRGEINVLLCTSIVESGLDIPNANTIIVNRADMFGLSQLYQLRGRVGRGSQRAYAYLLVPARRTLPDDAQKRLEVIQTYTDLGSGFHVASYDLEIRGAGNLLSDDQSGHVVAVGLDLYTELLEEAIGDIRGQELEDALEPEVNIPVEAYIPETYIPATSLRLMFYKRFSLARSGDELALIFEELVDRFGDPPNSVRNLRDLISVKIDLRRIGSQRLDAGMSAIALELDQRTPLDPARVLELVSASGGRWRLTAEMKLIYKLKVDESAQLMRTSRAILNQLLAL